MPKRQETKRRMRPRDPKTGRFITQDIVESPPATGAIVDIPLTVAPTPAGETGPPTDSPAAPRWNEIEHFVIFGRGGTASKKRVKPRDATRLEAFKKPATAAWNVAIPRSQLSKVLNGVPPGGSDDKWYVFADGPDASGDAVVYMVRNGSFGREIELKIKVPLDKEGGGGFAEADSVITGITWEDAWVANFEEVPEEGWMEEEMKAMALEVLYWVLDVLLEKTTEAVNT